MPAAWAVTWPDAIGFLGVALLISSYAALQLGRIEAADPRYSLANALAALLIAFSLVFNFNAASMVIELFWFVISVVGYVRGVRDRRRRSAGQKEGTAPSA